MGYGLALKRAKYLIPLLIFITLVLLLWLGLNVKPHELSPAIIDRAVPNFDLPASGAANRRINQEILKGHITVLHVWSSWCATCKLDHMFLQTINNTGQFQLVAINYKDLYKDADLWLQPHGDPYRVTIFDFEGRLCMDLGVYGTPTTFVVDREGIIRFRHVGALTNDVWQSKILPTLNKISS